MQVYEDNKTGKLALKDECTWEEEGTGELTTVFLDGKLLVDLSLSEIRKRLIDQLHVDAPSAKRSNSAMAESVIAG